LPLLVSARSNEERRYVSDRAYIAGLSERTDGWQNLSHVRLLLLWRTRRTQQRHLTEGARIVYLRAEHDSL
jgi:hypothetical protein